MYREPATWEALPNFFPGYQKVTDPAARSRFAAAWQLEAAGWKRETPHRYFRERVQG